MAAKRRPRREARAPRGSNGQHKEALDIIGRDREARASRTTEAGGARGYDAGKKINGRKRHALVDTDGRGLVLEPHPASVQDRDGGGPLLRASRQSFPFIERVFGDSGYAGANVAKAMLIRDRAQEPRSNRLRR